MIPSFPCVGCGHLTLDEPPGSSQICPVCYWEDDLVQLRWPTLAGGANALCLIQAQVTFLRVGACESRWIRQVRPASDDEPIDIGFTVIDSGDPRFEEEGVKSVDWPSDGTRLYWWRPTFWRSGFGSR